MVCLAIGNQYGLTLVELPAVAIYIPQECSVELIHSYVQCYSTAVLDACWGINATPIEKYAWCNSTFQGLLGINNDLSYHYVFMNAYVMHAMNSMALYHQFTSQV